MHLCAQLAFVDLTQARVILKVVKHLLGGLALGSGREVIVFWASQRGEASQDSTTVSQLIKRNIVSL